MQPSERSGSSVERGDADQRRLVRAQETTWALWAVLRTADEAEHQIARSMGLPYTDALALDHILSSSEPLGPVELGRRLGISAASATVLVDRLVASGYLIRRTHPGDGRRRILIATELAKRHAIEAMRPVLDDLDALADGLSKEATAAVIAYLHDVAAVHRKHSGSSRFDPDF